MVRTAIQLFTLRHLEEDLPGTISRVGETGFDGVECYDAHFEVLTAPSTRDATASALTDAGLELAGAHVGIDCLESDKEVVLEACRALGCTRLVIPSYPREAFTTRDGIATAADRLGALAADLGRNGIELLYHNHTFEFGAVDSGIAFEYFVEHADGRFGFEPDVGLARHGGYDPIDLLELVGGAAPLVHLTQTVPDDPERLHADPDEGVLDIGACAAVATANGAEWLICENGVTSDGMTSLARGDTAFSALRSAVGS